MKIKICGLTRPEEADYLNENNIDYAGFVLFYEKSRRNISIEDTVPIRERLSPKIMTVAVTVSPTPDMIRQICEAGFDYIQIHGAFPEDLVSCGCTIPAFMAVNLGSGTKPDAIKTPPGVTGLLFDAPDPGSGRTFDWDILSRMKRREDMLFILSGGLNAANVGEAVRCLSPDVVDVSSGVEYDSGNFMGKDPEKIRAFAKAARKAELS